MRRQEFRGLAAWKRMRPAVADSWMVWPQSRPNASFRVFCFPGAGTGTSAYEPWAARLPEHVEACLVQMPGRERRMDELPITRLHDLLDSLAVALLPHLDRPFGFFGHGAGAHIAFALARRLRRMGAPQPERLWLSACPAPQLARTTPPLSLLPPEAFVAEVLRLGLVDPDTAARPDRLVLMLPVLAADLAVWETARYEAEPPLACAISAFGGMRDGTAPWWELQAWRVQTTGEFRLRMMPGGHWYLRGCSEAMVQTVASEIRN